MSSSFLRSFGINPPITQISQKEKKGAGAGKGQDLLSVFVCVICVIGGCSGVRKRFLILLILAGFFCSLNGGLYWPVGNANSDRSSESLAIHSALSSIRNYALTNAPNPRAENNFTKPKPVKQSSLPGVLPEKVSKLNTTTHRSPFDGEVLFNRFSACCSQPQGRAPPLFA